jgi:hypothetical protein
MRPYTRWQGAAAWLEGYQFLATLSFISPPAVLHRQQLLDLTSSTATYLHRRARQTLPQCHPLMTPGSMWGCQGSRSAPPHQQTHPTPALLLSGCERQPAGMHTVEHSNTSAGWLVLAGCSAFAFVKAQQTFSGPSAAL